MSRWLMVGLPHAESTYTDHRVPGILYVFIASFNVVFMEMHGFNLGQNGLAFLVRPSCAIPILLAEHDSQGLFVGAGITYAFFAPYAIYVIKPMFKDGEESTSKSLTM